MFILKAGKYLNDYFNEIIVAVCINNGDNTTFTLISKLLSLQFNFNCKEQVVNMAVNCRKTNLCFENMDLYIFGSVLFE